MEKQKSTKKGCIDGILDGCVAYLVLACAFGAPLVGMIAYGNYMDNRVMECVSCKAMDKYYVPVGNGGALSAANGNTSLKRDEMHENIRKYKEKEFEWEMYWETRK